MALTVVDKVEAFLEIPVALVIVLLETTCYFCRYAAAMVSVTK
jgi:hypothetical protein